MKNKRGTGQKRAFLLGSKKDTTGQGKLLNNMFQHRARIKTAWRRFVLYDPEPTVPF